MARIVEIIDHLTRMPHLCDKCLAGKIGAKDPQSVNGICRRSAAIKRSGGTVCSGCQKTRVTNSLSGRPDQERLGNAEKRTRPTSAAKKTKTVRHRENELRDRFNEAMADVLNLYREDFFSRLNFDGLLKLKAAYSLINNVVTLKLSLALAEKISERLGLEPAARVNLCDSVNTSHANAIGFDIDSAAPNIIGEVKGNIPVTGGSVFGDPQQNGITDDVLQMFGKPSGKKKGQAVSKRNKIFRPERKGALKFLGLYDSERVREATARWMAKLLKNTTWQALQNEYGCYIKDLPETGDLSPDTVYIVYLSPTQPIAAEKLLVADVSGEPPMVELDV